MNPDLTKCFSLSVICVFLFLIIMHTFPVINDLKQYTFFNRILSTSYNNNYCKMFFKKHYIISYDIYFSKMATIYYILIIHF